MSNPLSAGVMCHSLMRTGSAKASANALNASKNVALPTTMRAFACHRVNGAFSRRAISGDSTMAGRSSFGECEKVRSDLIGTLYWGEMPGLRQDGQHGSWDGFVKFPG